MDEKLIIEELRKPLDVERVSKRQGAGNRQLSYLEAHDVIARMNAIFGYDGWSDKLESIQAIGDKMWMATVSVEARIGGQVVRHGDTGIGMHKKDGQEEIEKAVKEAASDALKRACRKFGDQFGNCLYEKDAPEHSGVQREETASTEEINEYNNLRHRAIKAGFEREIPVAQAGAPRDRILKSIENLRRWLQKNTDKGAVVADLISEDQKGRIQDLMERRYADKAELAAAAKARWSGNISDLTATQADELIKALTDELATAALAGATPDKYVNDPFGLDE